MRDVTSERATPALDDVLRHVLNVWPEHADHVRRRFDGCDPGHLAVCEVVAEHIRAIAPDLARLAENYRWTCRMMLAEEYHFRRTGAYRHTSFEAVRSAVYDDADFMRRYADGLLLSQLLWFNHTMSLQVYQEDFLAGLDPRSDLLEVGPGHGLLLGFAAGRLTSGRVTGWDISTTSLAASAAALRNMGWHDVSLERRDLLTAPTDRTFDAVVASELLEHLDRPQVALARLAELTRPGGRLFLNVPVNSPAPDHITLWRSPAEVHEFVRDSGLVIERSHEFPMTGKTAEEAAENVLTMSCVVICCRRDGDSR